MASNPPTSVFQLLTRVGDRPPSGPTRDAIIIAILREYPELTKPRVAAIALADLCMFGKPLGYVPPALRRCIVAVVLSYYSRVPDPDIAYQCGGSEWLVNDIRTGGAERRRAQRFQRRRQGPPTSRPSRVLLDADGAWLERVAATAYAAPKVERARPLTLAPTATS